jgi:hypothetical protein
VQSLDEAHSSPGLHAAAGSGLAEECATLVLFMAACGKLMGQVCSTVLIVDVKHQLSSARQFCREVAELGWPR